MNDAEDTISRPRKLSGIPAGAAEDIPRSGSAVPIKASSKGALESLAPHYDEGQHKTYLDRLEKAVEDSRNRNIALSGRYGTGKSSVLDKFQELHKDSTLRLAVSTLAPYADGVTLTNRIQKEVLKQLVYSARPRTLRHSRFSRRAPLSWWRAFGESALFVGMIGALLALLGRLPSQVATGSDSSVGERASVWALLAVLLVVAFAVLRMVTFDRFVLTDVSAAGATLTLSAPNHTYFDEHLDEIVYYFDQEPKDIVIFEDLDRYNDPQIFQALRELNTLLNNTPKRLRKIERQGVPLRFIYAMRDSLFERIGEDTAREGDDAARTETVRANRTKFFDVVIPVVPFISHRTAREHLLELLEAAGVTGIDRPLVELVAKHATDMRLLLNMCNEYLVFAERLLDSDKVAPGLSPSHLFALVAYKNFHLEDFENIARRSSDLDRLYDYHRKLVATTVTERERSKRELLAKIARPPAIGAFARKLGKMLISIGELERDRAGMTNWHLKFVVSSTPYDSDAATTPAFWDAVVASPSITLEATPSPQQGRGNQLVTITQAHLEALFPEALSGHWEERDVVARQERIQQFDREIEHLRGADFRNLVDSDGFALTVPVSNEDGAGDATDKVNGPAKTEEVTFRKLVQRTLKSDLACELVGRGYIDRNFTLYAAQFYGNFTGVDVATFIVQTVQSNSMDVNYQFTSPGSFANLLTETDEDFTRTIGAYNIQLVNYLLVNDMERAEEVVKHLASDRSEEAEVFMAAFFTSDGERARLAAGLSRERWREVFTYLITNEGVPANVRAALVDAALVAADPDGSYDLGSSVRDFLVTHYGEMPAFVEARPTSDLDVAVTMLLRAEVLLPSLHGVHKHMRELIVENDLYELTAENLRTALDLTGAVSLDRVRDNTTVYRYCLLNLARYLDAIETDDDTEYSVRSSQTLLDALEVADPDDKTLTRLTETASPDSSLWRLADAPPPTWPALAAAKLFRASLANFEAYRVKVGDVDESLGGLLLSTGFILSNDVKTDEPRDSRNSASGGADEDEAPEKAVVAVAVLNARRGIPSANDRVQLVQPLNLDERLPAAQITPEESDLFALLLECEMVPDEPATFRHLRTAGWAAVGPAVAASKRVEGFLTADLVEGMVAELFETPATSSKVGRQVLMALPEFLPADDRTALAAAARFAIQNAFALPVDQVRRVATTCKDAILAVQLLQITAPPASEIVAVLNELGSEYSNLTTWEYDEFEVPLDEAHRFVFKALAEADVCKVRKKPRQPFLVVERP